MPGRFQVAGCAIIEKDGKVLITRRSPSRWMGELWEFVTGRVEQSEDLITGLKREVREEVNLKINPLFPIYVSHFYRGKGHKRIKIPENEIFLITYVAKWVSGRVKLKTDEQDKFEWVNLKKIDFAIYPGLKEMYGKEMKAYLRLKR